MEMKHQDIIAQMSLEDKIALCSGKDFWHTKGMDQYGISPLMMCDGPHGLRKQEAEADMLGVNESKPATCFPAAVTTAASWNVELMRQIGRTIAREALASGVDVVLGPGANIKRNPLCGRNFEYLSEDPYLAGKMAAGFIAGGEETGVGTSLKHFACNSQEYMRFNSDSVMDERTLREIYLAAFETAVKEGRPSTVMCAYNKINGEHCSDSKMLLTDILRDEWGFDGVVVTDWGAMNDRIKGFAAGCDLNMPGGSCYMERETAEAVKKGILPEQAVDESASRMLELIRKCAASRKPSGKAFDKKAHHEMARQAAEEGIVLLKNDGILPLAEGKKIALIGKMAEKIRYQGAGSSHINPTMLVQPRDVLKHEIYAAGYDGRGNTSEELLAQALDAARRAEIAVVFAGLPKNYESEGFDRENMRMPEGHIRLIEAVTKANPNTVVVLLCGCAVECPWTGQAAGILYAGLPGQAGAEAIANILYGRVNPSGKLAETWPLCYDDCISASYYGKKKTAQYREGIYVGYRYYDTAQKQVRFPFGYGLSYTTFAYSDMQVIQEETKVRVMCRITNTGTVAGKETVQLYVSQENPFIYRPDKELKGFTKMALQPGETKEAVFLLDSRSFAVYQHGWMVPEGEYRIRIGGDSRHLPLERQIHMAGIPKEQLEKECGIMTWQKDGWYGKLQGIPAKEQWEQMLGHVCVEETAHKGTFTMDNSVEEMRQEAWIMRIMYQATERVIRKGMGKITQENEAEFKMMMFSSAGSPLRSMMISGGIKGGLLPGLLEIANGHFFRGIGKMLGIVK